MPRRRCANSTSSAWSSTRSGSGTDAQSRRRYRSRPRLESRPVLPGAARAEGFIRASARFDNRQSSHRTMRTGRYARSLARTCSALECISLPAVRAARQPARGRPGQHDEACRAVPAATTAVGIEAFQSVSTCSAWSSVNAKPRMSRQQTRNVWTSPCWPAMAGGTEDRYRVARLDGWKIERPRIAPEPTDSGHVIASLTDGKSPGAWPTSTRSG